MRKINVILAISILYGCGGTSVDAPVNNENVPHDPQTSLDTDKDGYPDYLDMFPNDPNEFWDTDGDNIGNNQDTDDDNDGILDTDDLFPLTKNNPLTGDDSPNDEPSEQDPTDGSGNTDNDSGETDNTGDNNGSNTDLDMDATVSLNDILIQATCVLCHSSSGPAKNSGLQFNKGQSIDVAAFNEMALSQYITSMGSNALLQKPIGAVSHGGGSVINMNSESYKALELFIEDWTMSHSNTEQETPSDNDDTNTPNTPLSSAKKFHQINVALNKDARSSSVGYGGTANLAVDGDTENWMHTSNKDGAQWLEIDLGEQYNLEEIVFYSRSGFDHRISNSLIAVSDEPISHDSYESAQGDESITTISVGAVSSQLSLMVNVQGRYVRIFGPGNEFLNFSEIQIHVLVETIRPGYELSYSDIALRCDQTQSMQPRLVRLTRNELVETIKAAFPSLGTDWEPTGLSGGTVTELGFSNDADIVVGSVSFVEEWLRASESVAQEIMNNIGLNGIAPCGDTLDCVKQQLPIIMERLSRTTIENDEMASLISYWQLANNATDEVTAWQWTLTAALLHPSVIYRAEIGQQQGDDYFLTGREIADAIAFTYTGKPADAELLVLADSGQLDSSDIRVQQAQRLLQSTAGQDRLVSFIKTWLKIDHVNGSNKDNIEDFSPLAAMMSEEALRLVRKVLIEDNGSISDLLSAPFTFMNPQLAQHYGYDHPGNGWAQLARKPNHINGILGTGAFLAGFSQAGLSSPTQRGIMVYQRLMCEEIPPQPDNIPSVEDEIIGDVTTRQRWEMTHAKADECQICHKNFDPIGYTFENFDELGVFRDSEYGIPIDASGKIPGPNTIEVQDANDLISVLNMDERVASCATGMLNHWAFSGGGGNVCLAEDARTRFAAGELSLLEYFAELAGGVNFVRRSK